MSWPRRRRLSNLRLRGSPRVGGGLRNGVCLGLDCRIWTSAASAVPEDALGAGCWHKLRRCDELGEFRSFVRNHSRTEATVFESPD